MEACRFSQIVLLIQIIVTHLGAITPVLQFATVNYINPTAPAVLSTANHGTIANVRPQSVVFHCTHCTRRFVSAPILCITIWSWRLLRLLRSPFGDISCRARPGGEIPSTYFAAWRRDCNQNACQFVARPPVRALQIGFDDRLVELIADRFLKTFFLPGDTHDPMLMMAHISEKQWKT